MDNNRHRDVVEYINNIIKGSYNIKDIELRPFEKVTEDIDRIFSTARVIESFNDRIFNFSKFLPVNPYDIKSNPAVLPINNDIIDFLNDGSILTCETSNTEVVKDNLIYLLKSLGVKDKEDVYSGPLIGILILTSILVMEYEEGVKSHSFLKQLFISSVRNLGRLDFNGTDEDFSKLKDMLFSLVTTVGYNEEGVLPHMDKVVNTFYIAKDMENDFLKSLPAVIVNLSDGGEALALTNDMIEGFIILHKAGELTDEDNTVEYFSNKENRKLLIQTSIINKDFFLEDSIRQYLEDTLGIEVKLPPLGSQTSSYIDKIIEASPNDVKLVYGLMLLLTSTVDSGERKDAEESLVKDTYNSCRDR